MVKCNPSLPTPHITWVLLFKAILGTNSLRTYYVADNLLSVAGYKDKRGKPAGLKESIISEKKPPCRIRYFPCT